MSVSSAPTSTLPPPPVARAGHVVAATAPPAWYTDMRVIAPVGLAAALALWTPSDDGVTICPFRNCTGGACPGCGLTRGAAALFKGDVAGSWYYHPAAMLIVVQTLALWSLFVARRLGVTNWQPSPALVRTLVVVNGVGLIGLWALRWRLGHLDRVL